MNIHECQAKLLLAVRGVPVPAGSVVNSPGMAGHAFDDLHVKRAVVKAQVHSGGRGKAGGVVLVGNHIEARAVAGRLIGTRLVTHQTGPGGLPVDKVLIEEALDIASEFYLSITLDRTSGCPLAIA